MTAGKSERGIFGEDLLDWLNRHYVSPTTEQAFSWQTKTNHGSIMTLARPRQVCPAHYPRSFISTLLRYAFRGIIPPLLHFLGILQNHPSPFCALLRNASWQFLESYRVPLQPPNLSLRYLRSSGSNYSPPLGPSSKAYPELPKPKLGVRISVISCIS